CCRVSGATGGSGSDSEHFRFRQGSAEPFGGTLMVRRPVGLITTEGDQPWTSKLYRSGGVGVSTSRKSRFIRSWSSSSRLCRSTFLPEGQRVRRPSMHRARLAVVPARPWLQRRERLDNALRSAPMDAAGGSAAVQGIVRPTGQPLDTRDYASN